MAFLLGAAATKAVTMRPRISRACEASSKPAVP